MLNQFLSTYPVVIITWVRYLGAMTKTLLASTLGGALATEWHGPSSLIWNDASCELLAAPGAGRRFTLARCQAACGDTAGCNALNFNTASTGTGSHCQLHHCATALALKLCSHSTSRGITSLNM